MSGEAQSGCMAIIVIALVFLLFLYLPSSPYSPPGYFRGTACSTRKVKTDDEETISAKRTTFAPTVPDARSFPEIQDEESFDKQFQNVNISEASPADIAKKVDALEVERSLTCNSSKTIGFTPLRGAHSFQVRDMDPAACEKVVETMTFNIPSSVDCLCDQDKA